MIKNTVLELMIEQGGAFNRKLAELYYSADSENAQRLELTFSDIFGRFQRLEAKTKLAILPTITLLKISGVCESEALFELGEVFITENAKETLQAFKVLPETLLSDHVTGQWRAMTLEDRQACQYAIENGERIRTSHRLHNVDDYDDMLIIWVVTEWDRLCTTILLPRES
jgi:hypothetical protein